MQYSLLTILRCPVTGSSLELKHVTEFVKEYEGGNITEIRNGILIAKTGWIYPVIEGIPRLLPEAIYDYAEELSGYFPDFTDRVIKLESEFSGLALANSKKNSRSKASFAFEWKFLHPERKDKIWHFDQESLAALFMQETGLQPDEIKEKIILDAGCGHGVMTSVIAGLGGISIGLELSLAVENAYKRNRNPNAHYIQGDVQLPPLSAGETDIVYSSGVIHHTNNTKLSLAILMSLLKPGGLICLWLYQPRDNKLHRLSLKFRGFISKLPLSIAAFFLIVFVFPFTFLFKKLKGKRDLHYREEIIDLLDAFTPEFRDEIPQAQAISWLQQYGVEDCRITSETIFGYSVSGFRK